MSSTNSLVTLFLVDIIHLQLLITLTFVYNVISPCLVTYKAPNAHPLSTSVM